MKRFERREDIVIAILQAEAQWYLMSCSNRGRERIGGAEETRLLATITISSRDRIDSRFIASV
jgi:hypothetical protein